MIKRNHERIDSAISFPPEEGRTKQSTVSPNINDIMKRYNVPADLVPISQEIAMYGDFSDIGDFQQALDQVRNAQAAFMSLPSEVRSMVENSPHKYIEWINNPDNWARAIELKLLDPPVAPATDPVVVVLHTPEGGDSTT